MKKILALVAAICTASQAASAFCGRNIADCPRAGTGKAQSTSVIVPPHAGSHLCIRFDARDEIIDAGLVLEPHGDWGWSWFEAGEPTVNGVSSMKPSGEQVVCVNEISNLSDAARRIELVVWYYPFQ
jgi:hypothetical protein